MRSTSEQESENTKGIQKFLFILSQFPNNLALRKIAQKRMLEIVDLTPEELRQVEEGEKQVQAAQPQENPQEELLAGSLQQKIGELNALTQ